MKTNTFLHGHALEILKTFPDGCIDMVFTSPPYWGLRVYDCEPVIWDDPGGCEHRWGESPMPHDIRWRGGPSSEVGNHRNPDVLKGNVTSQFCKKACGAWKGNLGLEPTPELYIQHLIQIFDEVKRVLKKEATCWVNMGDTYSGNGGGTSDYRDDINKSIQGKGESKECYPAKSVAQQIKTIPAKSLCQIPFRFAIAMTDRGWILRNRIVWHKPNCIPASVKDRFTVDFEEIFFFTKSRKYYFEQQFEPAQLVSIERLQRAVSNKHKYNCAVVPGQSMQGIHKPRPYKGADGVGRKQNCAISTNLFSGNDYLVAPFDMEKGRNKRCVWRVSTKSFSDAHFATFPPEIVETPIKAGSPPGGVVLDPFVGSGTTALVALGLGRKFIGIDISEKYYKMAQGRIEREMPLYA